MLILGLYVLIVLILLSWVAMDNNAIAAFEILKRNIHRTARDMGMYRQWLLYSLPRAALLISLVIAGFVVATWILRQNPFGLGWAGRGAVFAVMFVCTIAMLAVPHLWLYFHRKRFLYCKAGELMKLVSIVSSNEGVRQHLEQAEADVFDGVDGWTAWHPRNQWWNEEPLWTGLVPVVYLHESSETSLIVPVDFETLLAWKLPDNRIAPASLMPVLPHLWVNTVSSLRGREGWSIVRAEIDLDEAAG